MSVHLCTQFPSNLIPPQKHANAFHFGQCCTFNTGLTSCRWEKQWCKTFLFFCMNINTHCIDQENMFHMEYAGVKCLPDTS